MIGHGTSHQLKLSDGTVRRLTPAEEAALQGHAELPLAGLAVRTAQTLVGNGWLAGLGLLSVDLASGLSLFELRGPAAIELLLRDCTLDLEGGALPAGSCAQTPIAGVTLLLHRLADTEPCWRLFVDRSAARHFWSWLVDTAELLLDNPRWQMRQACLPDLPPVGVGVQAVVTHRDLPFIRDVGRHPGDELQLLHRLCLSGGLAVPICHFALLLHEKEPLQGQERPDHAL